ncbi:MAG: response regulator transcription factor [Firmicutes bacterium]|nr:response regulator transcription factor [Alicyclobacillaceae bacterium]MCL6497383.1 response regulator transcription factor [Bacillota bacterium]
MTVALVEDDADLRAVLRQYLEHDGHRVVAVGTGKEALMAAGAADLMILDLALPDLDGVEVLRRIRAAGHLLPILILTARGSEADRLLGLGLGADDYVVKPVSPREVCLRVGAILRRAQGGLQPERVLHCGGVTMWPDRHQVMADGQPVELTPHEFDLLGQLLAAPGHFVSREVLLARVWPDGYVSDHVLEVHIAALRRKLQGHLRIVAVRGAGYRLLAEEAGP